MHCPIETFFALTNDSNSSFLDSDSVLPSLKSKSKQLAASSSAAVTTEFSTLKPNQTDASSSSAAPSPPALAQPEPDCVEMPSEDFDAPQAEDSEAHQAKKDTAESEVSHLFIFCLSYM